MTYHIERQRQDGSWEKVETAGTQLPSWGFAYGVLQFYEDGTTRYAIVADEER